MNSWKDCQSLFAELSSPVNGIRLELRFGEGEEDWLVDVSDVDTRREFLELCANAGKLLPKIHLSNHETGSLVDPEIRWFRLLRERNTPSATSPVLIDKAGVALSEWSLEDVANRSADLCSDLHRSSPIQKRPGWFRKSLKQDPIGTSLKIFGALALGFILLRLISR